MSTFQRQLNSLLSHHLKALAPAIGVPAFFHLVGLLIRDLPTAGLGPLHERRKHCLLLLLMYCLQDLYTKKGRLLRPRSFIGSEIVRYN